MLPWKSKQQILLCSNIKGTHFGCYLFANENEDVWVRSGSATGERGIPGRLDDHLKRAKMDANHDDTWFYDAFPHSASARSRSKAKEGLFEYLQPHVGVSFGDDARTLEMMRKDVAEGEYSCTQRRRRSASVAPSSMASQRIKKSCRWLRTCSIWATT